MRRIACGLLALLLSGCAAGAQTRPAYVDVNALVPQDPLYGTLAQYDRQIAALEGTLHTRFANADAAIANASRAVSRDAQAVSARYRATAQAPVPPAFARRALNVTPTAQMGSGIAQTITQNYRQQRTDLQDTAQRDMARYRSALAAQEQHAYAAFADSVNERTQQALALRAQELRERESDVLLELARKAAPQRLLLRAKLQTLALTGPTRAGFQNRLRALQNADNAALAGTRRADDAVLQTYARSVRARAQSDLALMRVQLAARAAGNLNARERVLQAQTSGAPAFWLAPAPRATGAPPNAQAGMQTQYDALRNLRLPDAAIFGTTRDDLTARWDTLRRANDDDTAHTQSQIAWLRHDREAVRKRIVAQIMYEAGQIAKAHGYAAVIGSRAAPGSVDLTPLVAADLRALSP
ncbi:MAG: hypothetical protein ABR508_09745 [Candidatus Baltobacteraceae bacterium]